MVNSTAGALLGRLLLAGIAPWVVAQGPAQSYYKPEAGRTSFARPTLSHEALDKALVEHPPRLRPSSTRWDVTETRRRLVRELTAHVYWEGPLSESLAKFYRRRVKRALGELRQREVPSKGVLLWKVYSSSVLVKSREGVFGFDVVEGPVPCRPELPEKLNERPIPDTEYGRTRLHRYKLHWTPEMRRQYAATVDVHFISHIHPDHFSAVLVSEVLAQGKAVVAPQEVRDKCREYGVPGWEKINVPTHDPVKFLNKKVVTVKDVKVLCFNGYQDEYARKVEDGRLILVFNPKAVQNNVYVLKIGGLRVLHTGDVEACPSFLPWLANLVGTGWAPDVCLAVPYHKNMVGFLRRLFDPVIIRLHDLELSHTRLKPGSEDPRSPMVHVLPRDEDLLWGEGIFVGPR